jgi:hypothetical protein
VGIPELWIQGFRDTARDLQVSKFEGFIDSFAVLFEELRAYGEMIA